MDLTGKKVLVVGLARTGVALTHFLVKAGARVTVTDMAPAAELAEMRAHIQGLPVAEELEVPEPVDVWRYDLILPSPGVPPELPWLEMARRHGIPVWGELELASHFLSRPVLAVSGTNGKTTTITLVGKFLSASGVRALVGGNIGTPLISLLGQQQEADYVVTEISSFQLDTAPHFHPQSAALLNISPDHLDRYPNYAAYVASKASLFKVMDSEDPKVLNYDDLLVRPLGQGLGQVSYFSASEPLTEGAWLADGVIKVRLTPGVEAEFPLAQIRLQGSHNLENIMAALLLSLAAGAAPQACMEVLATFTGLPHRLEWVANISGVDFFDDSKGTNVGAVARSLASFDRPIILIAGGRDKFSDFSQLNELIQKRVKALVLLGETKERLAQVWEGLAPAYLTAQMTEAVEQAASLAQPGEVVLLSPACASFDMYRDYAHRGKTFQNAVKEIGHAEKS
jgi:UDP-N-acetylmuramoylalanine--D-glutamate ligase